MSRRYTKDDVEEIRFYQMPKVLFQNPIYSNLSDSAKVTYSILRDRQDLSIKNEWYDEMGNIFFYFDSNKLAELQGKSPTTIHKNKKELIKHELLESKRIGQGKPNKLYVLKPESLATVENYNNCNSRTTKTDNLELQEMVYSDTDVLTLERKDTETLTSKFHFDDNVKSFLEEYETYFNHPHRRIKKDVSFDVDMEEQDIRDAANHFFMEYGIGDKKHDQEKCSVNNFAEHLKRYEKDGVEEY